jgi:hypothetical protein
MAGGAMFSCDSCGKQYPWKAELAGKKAKCKCGALLNIPAQPQVARSPARAAVAVAVPVDESQGYRCPACKNELNPGTAICVNCGYDLRTGEYVNTQVDTGDDGAEAEAVPTPKKKKKLAAPAKTGKPSATAWVGVTKSKREKASETEKDNSRTMKQVIIALVLCVVVVGVIFGGKFVFSKMGSKGPQVKLPGDDSEAMRMLEENQPMEAAAFIESHKSRMIGTQWTQAKALAKIKQWYEMGAVKIWVPSDGLIARQVIIELPQDKEKRHELLQMGARMEDETGQKVAKDVGQKYVIVYP